MSEESKSEELRLPEELAALEALLAAKPLAATGIDRDQLMYRAGWAACEAQVSSPALQGGAREGILDRRRIATWSFASASLAAAIAVTATLGWVDAAKRGEAERAGGETPRLAEGGGLPQTLTEVKSLTSRDVSAAEVDRLLSGRDDRLMFAGPWFAMKQRGLDRATSGNAVRADRVTTTDLAPPSAKTARELWNELNPKETATPSPVWPWSRPFSGDSI